MSTGCIAGSPSWFIATKPCGTYGPSNSMTTDASEDRPMMVTLEGRRGDENSGLERPVGYRTPAWRGRRWTATRWAQRDGPMGRKKASCPSLRFRGGWGLVITGVEPVTPGSNGLRSFPKSPLLTPYLLVGRLGTARDGSGRLGTARDGSGRLGTARDGSGRSGRSGRLGTLGTAPERYLWAALTTDDHRRRKRGKT